MNNNDIQELINHCHKTAERLLVDQGEFYPVGASININGELIAAGFYDGDDFPLSDTVIAGLKNSFEKDLNNKKIRAYAIALDTKVNNTKFQDSIDAISIRITHKDIKDIPRYFFAYRLLNQRIEFLDSWAEYND